MQQTTLDTTSSRNAAPLPSNSCPRVEFFEAIAQGDSRILPVNRNFSQIVGDNQTWVPGLLTQLLNRDIEVVGETRQVATRNKQRPYKFLDDVTSIVEDYSDRGKLAEKALDKFDTDTATALGVQPEAWRMIMRQQLKYLSVEDAHTLWAQCGHTMENKANIDSAMSQARELQDDTNFWTIDQLNGRLHKASEGLKDLHEELYGYSVEAWVDQVEAANGSSVASQSYQQ